MFCVCVKQKRGCEVSACVVGWVICIRGRCVSVCVCVWLCVCWLVLICVCFGVRSCVCVYASVVYVCCMCKCLLKGRLSSDELCFKFAVCICVCVCLCNVHVIVRIIKCVIITYYTSNCSLTEKGHTKQKGRPLEECNSTIVQLLHYVCIFVLYRMLKCYSHSV